MITYVEEAEPVLKRIIPDEEPYCIGRLRLKIAVLDIQDLIEETTYMEAKSILFLFSERLRIFVVENPTSLRECELQLVTIVLRVV